MTAFGDIVFHRGTESYSGTSFTSFTATLRIQSGCLCASTGWITWYPEKKGFPNFKAYTEYRVRRDLNMTMEEAVQAFMDDLLEGLAPYDEKTFGELPKILLEQVLEPEIVH